jgi:FKBP-type peptidyl-prolyl cis-trans isomerase SlyD
MQVSKDKVVSIDYTLTNAAGQTLDTSAGREPLAYIQGNNNIIPGLENALEGKQVGEKLTVTVPPEQAYGNRDESLLLAIPRESFGEIQDIKPGMQFQMDSPNGPLVITVTEATETEVKVDGNHPLAGETLTFDVEIVDVREASQEELAHGHVHGAGGHQH